MAANGYSRDSDLFGSDAEIPVDTFVDVASEVAALRRGFWLPSEARRRDAGLAKAEMLTAMRAPIRRKSSRKILRPHEVTESTVTAPPEVRTSELRTRRRRISVRRYVRWPTLLCGFIASVATGAALMASPFGSHPLLQRAVTTAHAQGMRALTAARAAIEPRVSE